MEIVLKVKFVGEAQNSTVCRVFYVLTGVFLKQVIHDCWDHHRSLKRRPKLLDRSEEEFEWRGGHVSAPQLYSASLGLTKNGQLLQLFPSAPFTEYSPILWIVDVFVGYPL